MDQIEDVWRCLVCGVEPEYSFGRRIRIDELGILVKHHDHVPGVAHERPKEVQRCVLRVRRNVVAIEASALHRMQLTKVRDRAKRLVGACTANAVADVREHRRHIAVFVGIPIYTDGPVGALASHATIL